MNSNTIKIYNYGIPYLWIDIKLEIVFFRYIFIICQYKINQFIVNTDSKYILFANIGNIKFKYSDVL